MKTRVLIAAFTVTLASIFAVVTSPGAAFAANCTPFPDTNHCYAIDYYNGGVTAAGADLEVWCLSTANPSNNFATYEMWVGTGQSTWAEIGMNAGILQGGYTGFNWYWAEKRSDGSYYEHRIPGGAATGVATNASAYWQGGGNWSLFKGGTYVGSSTDNGGRGTYTESGTEVTTTAMTVEGQSDNYQRQDSAGWHWMPSDNYISPNATGLFTTFPSTGYYEVETGCGAAQPKAAPAAPIPSSPAQAAQALTAIAQQAAAAGHSRRPAQIHYVKTTRQRAEKVLAGATVTTSQPVYVIALSGHFTHPGPPRANETVTGTTMTITVDAATGQITDWGISPAQTLPLAQLGQVRTAP
jgi:hypothetical protein